MIRGMIVSALYLMIGAVAYAPPSNADALEAIKARISGDTPPLNTYRANAEFPDQVRIIRCQAEDSFDVSVSKGFSAELSGQLCLLTIIFPAQPEYQLDGFFHYNGVSWDYYGQIYAHDYTGPNTYAVQGKQGVQTPIEGGILYDGRAGIGDALDPYDKLFSVDDDWVRRPSKQRLRYDFETDERFKR